MIQWPHPGKQRWKVNDREHTTRAEGTQEARVDRRRIRQMVVDTPQDDGVAAIRGQPRVVGQRVHDRDIGKPRGADCGADALQAFGVDVDATSPASAIVSSPLPAPTSATDIPGSSARTCLSRGSSGPLARNPNPRQVLKPATVMRNIRTSAAAAVAVQSAMRAPDDSRGELLDESCGNGRVGQRILSSQ